MAITHRLPTPLRRLFALFIAISMAAAPLAAALMPYAARSPSLLDALLLEDPFRILEQSPHPIGKAAADVEPALALARADWKETPAAHLIALDVPGISRDDVKIEVEDGRVLRVSGERKAVEDEGDGERWHRAERAGAGKFWRQFRLPANADLDAVEAKLENGVLRIKVPKLAEEKRKRAKIVDIAASVSENAAGQGVKTPRTDL